MTYQFYWTRYTLQFIKGPEKNKKTVALGLCLKRKTGSKDILTWLDRLDHCISYDKVNRTEIYLAETESKNNTNERLISSNMNLSSFITFVIIIHNLFMAKVSTNMIMIQPQEPNHILINEEPTFISDVTYQRRSCFKPISMDIHKYQPVKRTTLIEIKSVKKE